MPRGKSQSTRRADDEIEVRELCGASSTLWRSRSDRDASVVSHTHNDRKSTSMFVASMRAFRAMFLPEGYPHSVSRDYTAYQVCDTLQALCSSVTGTLSTRAILQGVGVGEAEATALSGTLQWVTRDGTGMVGRILFATVVASDLDNDAKRWRLAADITNDIGLALEVVSSHLPRVYFLPVVCLASLFKAVTGVAGGATRASLTQHFAIRQNMADVSAKDGSQETAVNLIGMFLGMLVATLVPETFMATVVVFAVFTVLHLLSNYVGVKSLVLHHLNEERLLICIERYLASGEVPPPAVVNPLEGGVVQRRREVTVTLGASLRKLVLAGHVTARTAVDQVGRRGFAVVKTAESTVAVVLGPDVDAETLLVAYVEALALGCPSRFSVLVSHKAAKLRHALEEAGWALDRVQLRVREWRVDV